MGLRQQAVLAGNVMMKIDIEGEESVTHEGGQLGEERGDVVTQAQGGEGRDPGVRGPDTDPQQDVGDGHLGDLHLGAVLVILPAGPEALHVHLLGLGPEGGLVSHHGPHNVHIEGADQDHGSEEVEDVGEEEEGPPVDILQRQVVLTPLLRPD